jgi:uncharacterized lipoprotein YmbA
MRLALPLLAALTLAACASVPDDPTAALAEADVVTRTESNGDVISEYRVAGQLRIVKIVPKVGVTYYLIDDDNDGRLDRRRGEGPISPVNYTLFKW